MVLHAVSYKTLALEAKKLQKDKEDFEEAIDQSKARLTSYEEEISCFSRCINAWVPSFLWSLCPQGELLTQKYEVEQSLLQLENELQTNKEAILQHTFKIKSKIIEKESKTNKNFKMVAQLREHWEPLRVSCHYLKTKNTRFTRRCDHEVKKKMLETALEIQNHVDQYNQVLAGDTLSEKNLLERGSNSCLL